MALCELERRKALGSVFFDVAKYLLTTTAVGSFVVEDINLVASTIAAIGSFVSIAIAYICYPSRQEEVTWK